MPRDYKNRRPPAARTRSGPPRWACVVAGFGLGLVVAVAAYVEGRYPGTVIGVAMDEAPAPAPPAGAPVAAAEGRERTARPKFTFYDLLPEMEVSVPVRRQPPRATPLAPVPTNRDGERAARILAGQDAGAVPSATTEPDVDQAYMVQVGSFRELSDADRLKASLALNGHQAVIQTARLSDHSERHRVRLGPFESIEAAKRVSSRLEVRGAQPLLVRIES